MTATEEGAEEEEEEIEEGEIFLFVPQFSETLCLTMQMKERRSPISGEFGEREISSGPSFIQK